MFKEHFYHATLRRITIAFGSLFNDIDVVRTEKATGKEIQRIKVPINYGPKEAYIARIAEDPDLKREVAISLPRLTFERTGMTYAGERKLNRKHLNVKNESETLRLKQFTPVAYDLNYELNILSKSAYDADQIVEQILPFFTPSFDVTIKAIPELGLTDDVPIILNGIRQQDDYETNYVDRRVLIWTLDFTIKANFYGPIRDQEIIRKVQTDLLIPAECPITDDVIAETPRSVRITTVPDPIDAEPDDDFGYSQTVDFFVDNKKYNPVTGQDEDL